MATRSTYSEEVVDEILSRIAAGESLTAIRCFSEATPTPDPRAGSHRFGIRFHTQRNDIPEKFPVKNSEQGSR